MKKLLLSLAVVGSFLVYSIHKHIEASPLQKNSYIYPTSAPTNTISTVSPSIKTGWKDGNYTGNSADAFYGNIQVRATIQNGSLVQVEFLQYPNDRSTSVEINSQAMPLLQSEAIQAQSANVDIISGATDTSNAFRESLASALSQAK